MPWYSIFAEYFICWWITLFMVLPVGLRTQGDEKKILNGSVESAPANFRFWRMMLMNTLVAIVVYGIFYYLTEVRGLSAISIPRIVPEFK
jgi:predicted secreted protein